MVIIMNRSIQKAFLPVTPGCTEHHLKLASVLAEARNCSGEKCNIYYNYSNNNFIFIINFDVYTGIIIVYIIYIAEQSND